MSELSNVRIALGSVQWGLRYGVANNSGQPSINSINSNISTAKCSGIDFIDTAPAYGVAEEVIGTTTQNLNFNVITKILPYGQNESGSNRIKSVMDGFFNSLVSLKRDSVYGLLVHHAEELFGSYGISLWQSILTLKSRGLVKKIGVSVYDPQQLLKILDRFEIDLVQLPLNIYDQRFIQSGLLTKLKSFGVEIHARSALLQGALIIDPAKLPNHLSLVRSHQIILHEQCRLLGITPLEAAIGFCLKQPEVDKVVLGCENLNQLKEIVAASKVIFNMSKTDFYAFDVQEIIDPRLWVSPS